MNLLNMMNDIAVLWSRTIMLYFVTLVAVFTAAIVLYLRQISWKFRKYGIKFDKPLPFLENVGKVLIRKEHFAENIDRLYKKFPEERFVGRYEFINVQLMIRDLELVKQITVKDFEHFLDHRSIFSNSNSSMFSRSLFALRGQEWKDMRATLMPAFASSKIRLMIPFMVEVGNQMVATLKERFNNSNNNFIDIDCMDLTTRYAIDVIATCVFGLKINSHMNKNNPFYEKAKEVTSVSVKQLFMLFLSLNFPKLARKFGLDFMSPKSKFFKKLVLEAMKERELKQIMRPDMIQLLMEAKKGTLSHEDVKPNDIDVVFATPKESSVGDKDVNREWSDEDLIAQSILFFIGGLETATSTMCFLFYELAVNPDVQYRLAKEIKEQDAKSNRKIDFDSIINLPYLDMVVSETLRLWPPALVLDRECNDDYNLGKPNKSATTDYIACKGTYITIPVYALHRDPKYFPNPESFDPERFSVVNRHKINPYAYVPFGVGPRNCIGSRFALYEIKAITYQILLHWELLPAPTTRIPAKLCPNSFNIKLQGGHNLRFKLKT